MNAFLRPELSAGKISHAVYGNADGTGSSKNPAVARHKAISEALERWAFLAVHRAGPAERAKYGFDHDRSSNGMAAYPGLRFQARRAARFEALERWALIGWWAGHFPAEVSPVSGHPGVGRVRIRHGEPGEVVVLYHQAASGVVAYGHAAGASVQAATERAMGELARAEFVLARHRAKGALATVSNYFEQRVVHFSTEEGFAEFNRRLATKPDRPAPVWRTIFDGEIPGPWSKWATVWRHCVEMPTHAFLNKEENFFFW